MANEEHEPIAGVWGGAPSGERYGLGIRGFAPLKLKVFLAFEYQMEVT